MKMWVCVALLALSVAVFGNALPVSAESLRIQPLQYKTELKKGERKKGFVDIANPSNEAVEAKFYVEAFKQVDSKGNLAFFKDEQLQKGLLLDYDSVKIGARQTLRLFFIADGTKLPTGDVFGVIFAETSPVGTGARTAVRVGSLVMITNQTPGSRNAEITDVTVPFLQIGSMVTGTATIKNPAPKGQATGFSPKVSVSVTPWGATSKQDGPLIFAGISRTVEFEQPSNAFGVYTVTVTANNAKKSAPVLLVTGWWRIIAPIMLLVIAFACVVIWHKARPSRRRKSR